MYANTYGLDRLKKKTSDEDGNLDAQGQITFNSPFFANEGLQSTDMNEQGPPQSAGQNDQVLTVYHLFFWVAICAGAGAGWAGGAEWHGVGGGMAGALIGGWLGFLLGKLPEILVLKWLYSHLSGATSNELRDFLHQPDCHIPNVVLLELQRRGEDIYQELGVILDLLVSKEVPRRALGWAALNSAFPDLALELCDYSIVDSIEECRRKTKTLRADLEPARNPGLAALSKA
jgi:hypothetical protein